MAQTSRKDKSPKDIKAQDQRENQLKDLRKVLSTLEGRRTFWRLIEHCRPFASIWEPSAKIHFNAGKQDVGHFIMTEILEADDELMGKMMIESKKGEYSYE
jgi:hypothetical protein